MRSLKTRGVALLMSLSVILLLSIALMQSFESRSIEVKHLENSQNLFQASTLSRSVFRILLTLIKEQGVYGLFVYSNRIQGLTIPLEDLGEGILISGLKVTSLDHLYYINDRLKTNDQKNIGLLRNLIEQIKQKESISSDPYALDEKITNFISALIDWIDTDTDLDDTIDYASGGEDYYDANPPFSVKNREIEFLDELNLIPSFRELNLSNQQITDNFRANYLKTNANEAIDINLASKDEIVNFLKRYQTFESEYPSIINHIDEIATLAKNQDDSENGFNTEAKYTGDIETSYQGSRWQEDLDANTITLNSKEQALFSFRTHLLKIRYDLYVNDTAITIESVLGLKYSSDTKKNTISKITILDFRIL